MCKSVVMFPNPEVVCANDRAYGEGFVEEVITISRKRALVFFLVVFFFLLSISKVGA